MKKSLRKIISVFIAVLMIVSSLPLTALAAVGDYHPNMQLRFGTFHPDSSSGWTDYTTQGAGTTFNYCSLFDVPVDFNYKRNYTDGSVGGELYIDAEKSQRAAKDLAAIGTNFTPYDEDYTFGVGDYFTVTLFIEDVHAVTASTWDIRYSDNVQPACLYTTPGRPPQYVLGTLAECEAAGGTPVVGGRTSVKPYSFNTLYRNDSKDPNNPPIFGGRPEDSALTENGLIYFDLNKPEDNRIRMNFATQNLNEVKTIKNEYFADPETGALDGSFGGYDSAIVSTWAFKIVDEGPIEFGPWDPFGIKEPEGTCGGMFGLSDEFGTMDKLVSYSKNTTNLSPEEIAAGKENEGSRNWTFMDFNINREEAPPECDHSETTLEKVKAATCTEKGYTGDTVCTKCQEVITYGKEIPALNHDFSGEAVSDNAGHHSYKCVRYNACQTMGDPEDCTYGEMEIVKPATPKEEGIGKYTCTVCGYSYEVNIPVTQCEHNNTEIRDKKDATCTQEGYTGDTWCTDCNTKIATGKVIDKLAHTSGEAVRENEVPATCQKEGSYDEVVKCSKCGHEISRETKKIDKLPHTPGEAAREDVVEATCQKEGSYNEVVRCTKCNEILSSTPKTIEKLAHTPGEMTIENRVEPTVDAEGGYDEIVRCTECKEVISTKHVVIPMLKSYEVTVDASDMGTVTLNGEDVTAGATKKIAAGTEFTLEAKAVDGAKFIGWVVNGTTTVSTDAKLTAKALADIKYTPVFAEDTADKFTVTFIDAFNNIISSQEVSSGAEVVIPEAPARPGYRFATENGWSLTNDEIKALDSAAVINAQYEKLGNTFTVTADGSKISVDGAEAVADKAEAVYDSLVTVTNDKATAWKVNGAVVGYGTSYTFYVGADVTVEAVTDAVTATPVVANIAVSETGEKGKVQAVFLATRTMTDNCKYITSGFVYGAGDLGEKTLDDVDGKAVKAAYTKTSVEQFSLTYGLRSQTGTVTARAFLVYEDENGEVKTIYTAPQTYTYASN